jgi:ribosomal protein S18 acetylase RimI-like enzyme
MLTLNLESRARELGYHVLNLDVRETQTAAIRLYQSMGYVRWGEHPEYALIRGRVVSGFFFYKRLRPPKGNAEGLASEPESPEE